MLKKFGGRPVLKLNNILGISLEFIISLKEKFSFQVITAAQSQIILHCEVSAFHVCVCASIYFRKTCCTTPAG